MKIEKYDYKINENEIDNLLKKHLFNQLGKKRPEQIKLSYAAFDDGIFLGGITAKKEFEVMYVDLFAVSILERGKGVGKLLLNEVEMEADKLGCKKIFLNTQDYQAKEFYEFNGYEIKGVIEDIPFLGTKRYYFVKKLNKKS